MSSGARRGDFAACLRCYLTLALGYYSCGPFLRSLVSLLYLAKTAVLWVASVLCLEQGKYCNTCQELNFIFKSCFLQNRISVTFTGYSRSTHGNDLRSVTWAFLVTGIYFIGLFSRGTTSFQDHFTVSQTLHYGSHLCPCLY